ncbi:hypothetical protein AAEX28_10695 [Lentisphaerota bacterium WC36G]|nr:hypothetical protein LJT99_13540 [Lentisphaerae bacterium WC36]
MNKSILIVICDFIVLSVLSLSTGLNPEFTKDSNYSGNVLVTAQNIDKILKGLAEREKKVQQMEKQLQKNSTQLLSKDSALAKIAATLEASQQQNVKAEKVLKQQAQLNKEISDQLAKKIAEGLEKERLLAIEKSQRNATELTIKKVSQENEQTKKQLNKIVESKQELEKELSKKNIVLAQKASQLYGLSKEVTALEKTTKEQQAKLKDEQQKLELSSKKVTNLQQEVKKHQEDNEEFFDRLAYAQGKLASTQIELENAKKEAEKLSQNLKDKKVILKKYQNSIKAKHNQLVAANRELRTKDSQLAQATTKLNDTATELNNVANELKEKSVKLTNVTTSLENKEQQLSQVTKKVGALKDNLETTKSQLLRTGSILDETIKKMQNDVLKSYQNSALKLSYSIEEKGLFSSSINSKVLYIPEISGAEFNYILADFNKLFDIPQSKIASYSKVRNVKYSFNDAVEPKVNSLLNGMILALKIDPRVCLIAIPKRERGLNIINRNDLLKRGLNELYLFKNDSFGEESVRLDERVSFSLDKKDNYLYIRNSSKHLEDGQLFAQEGDFVLTKAGEYVGLVVSVDKKTKVAKCFIMPDTVDLGNSYHIPLTKQDVATNYYENFARKVNTISEKINSHK